MRMRRRGRRRTVVAMGHIILARSHGKMWSRRSSHHWHSIGKADRHRRDSMGAIHIVRVKPWGNNDILEHRVHTRLFKFAETNMGSGIIRNEMKLEASGGLNRKRLLHKAIYLVSVAIAGGNDDSRLAVFAIVGV